MAYIIWPIVAFVLCSIPFGLFIAKSCANIDPREDGSRNTGATNVARLCGFKYGVATLVLDVGKGFVSVLMASAWMDSDFGLSIVVLAAILGHAFSCFMDFKGGKAVATTVGAFLAVSFWEPFLRRSMPRHGRPDRTRVHGVADHRAGSATVHVPDRPFRLCPRGAHRHGAALLATQGEHPPPRAR